MSIGAVAMSVFTVIVAVNAQLLRRLQLQRVAPSVVTRQASLTHAASG
ncbi:MAG: copper-transporting ATPase [Acidobacteria bacterium]|nr:MAG: copper-transporting ATPase [Acidobacteriota bacterium]